MFGEIELKPGTRVRLLGHEAGLKLQADNGTIVQPDEWLGYYIIHLDLPAYYEHIAGEIDLLEEISEAEDNLEVLSAAEDSAA